MKQSDKHTLYELLCKMLERAEHMEPSIHLDAEQKKILIQEMCEEFDPFAHIMGTDEAAQKWSLSQKHVETLIKSKKIRSTLIGRSRILDRNQVYQRERSPKKYGKKSEIDEK